MQAPATMANQREHNEQARTRALVRFNGSTFHSLVTASFLETAVPLHVDRVARTFEGDPDVKLWLEQVWWPRRAELGRRLREYIEAVWPEFDWNAAYEEFHAGYRPRSRPMGTRGALALCTTEAQVALFYRALANSADEPALRVLARMGASEHAAFFDSFRTLFERCKRSERVGFASAWRTITAACRGARDHDVAAAFRVLEHHWKGAGVVPSLGYPEYRQRIAPLIRRHAGLGPIDRLLFRSWIERERVPQEVGAGGGLPLVLRPVAA
jgi:hypothetical protein